MSMTKLFKLLCILPVLVGCDQGIGKETLVIFGYSELGEEMPSEYLEQLKDVNTFYPSTDTRYDVTPKELKGVCKLYAHDLYMIDTLVYEDKVYSVRMDNDVGFTRLAYYKNDYKEALYYSRDIGSGRHILQIGAFNFKEKQDMAVDIGFNEITNNWNFPGVAFDLVTHVQSDKKMLGAREIKTDGDGFVLSNGLLYEDLTTYQFASWNKYIPQQ